VKETCGRCAAVVREKGKALASCDYYLGAREVLRNLRSQPLAPPADARFNGAVRFVYRHENVIRVVLTETRKVYQQAVLIGHGEGNL